MLAPVRTVAPEITPVTLDEVKGYLRVDHTDDDALISALIGAAVAHLDGWTGILGRCLVEQTWRQDFEGFASCLPLPLGPVINIVSVANGAVTIDPGSYALKVDAGGRARVEFNSGVSASGPVSVTFRAGYVTTPASSGPPAVPAKSTVPDALKIAILLLAGHWYANREAVTSETAVILPLAVDALITPYRRIGV